MLGQTERGIANWSRSDDGIDEQESVSLRAGPCVCSMKNALKPSNFNSLHHRLYELLAAYRKWYMGFFYALKDLKVGSGKKNTRTNACKHVVLFYEEKIEPTSLKKGVYCMRGSFPLVFVTVTRKFSLFMAWKFTTLVLKEKERKSREGAGGFKWLRHNLEGDLRQIWKESTNKRTGV